MTLSYFNFYIYAMFCSLYFRNLFREDEKVLYLPISERIEIAINSYGHKAKVINYFAENLMDEIKAT